MHQNLPIFQIKNKLQNSGEGALDLGLRETQLLSRTTLSTGYNHTLLAICSNLVLFTHLLNTIADGHR